jgi:hypothetical protein
MRLEKRKPLYCRSLVYDRCRTMDLPDDVATQLIVAYALAGSGDQADEKPLPQKSIFASCSNWVGSASPYERKTFLPFSRNI